MMAKLPEYRYQTAEEVARALGEFTPRAKRARKPRRWLALTVTLLFALVAGSAGVRYYLHTNEEAAVNEPKRPASTSVGRKEAASAASASARKSGEIRHLTGHGPVPVQRMVVAADGGSLWSIANDLRLWDLSTGKTSHVVADPQLSEFYQPIPGMARGTSLEQVAKSHWYDELLPSPNGQQLLTTDGAGGYIRLHDAKTMKEVRAIGPGPSRYWQAAWFPDGRRLVTGGADEVAWIWDLSTGKSLRELTGHTPPVSCVDVSPDGSRILTASFADSRVRLWDPKTGAMVLEIPGQFGRPNSARFLPEDTAILSCGRDGTIRLFDSRTSKEKKAFPAPAKAVSWALFTVMKDGRHFISAASDGFLRLWNLGTAQELYHAPLKETVVSLEVTPDGRQLFIGTDAGEILQWDLPPFLPAKTLRDD
jgi:WD40 repeat protein